jgi:hypothetical protein
MDVLDEVPRLSIPRDAAPSFYSRSAEGPSGRDVRRVPVGGAWFAEIALCLDVWGNDGGCDVCAGLDRVGLLRRVTKSDAPLLRAERVVLTCSSCGALFVRPNGGS